MPLQTEFDFKLPKGYVDGDGTLQRDGRMRLATAADEILPLKDPRVKNNPSYLTVIVLARVVTQLGSLEDINPRIIEGLFVEDLAYLQDLYRRINGGDEETEPNAEVRAAQGELAATPLTASTRR
jgi:hypothetical protein